MKQLRVVVLTHEDLVPPESIEEYLRRGKRLDPEY